MEIIKEKKELLALTEQQYSEIASQLTKDDDHLLCGHYLPVDGKKHSPATIGRFIYKYMFPDVEIANKYRWQKCDYGKICINPEHVNYISKEERVILRKRRREEQEIAEKKRERERWLAGYDKCIYCNEEFMRKERFPGRPLSACSLECVIFSHCWGKGGFMSSSLRDYELTIRGRPCWIGDHDSEVFTCGLVLEVMLSLHELAIRAAFGRSISDPGLAKCPKHDRCVNPSHYIIISKQEATRADEAKVRLGIIERMPYSCKAGFKKWYRKHLFAQISDAFVKNDNEKAEEFLAKLSETEEED